MAQSNPPSAAQSLYPHLPSAAREPVPHVKYWAQAATTNPDVIAEWWMRWPLAMPGVPLERCSLVVVDCDRHGGADGVAALRELGELPPHPITTTKSGGEHHWFRQPAQPIRFTQWAGGEVLGEGRFVVGYAVPEGEIPELPDVFGRSERNPRSVVSLSDHTPLTHDPVEVCLASSNRIAR
jgi:hypothetical protein